jgi:hypothetical protein
MGGGLRQQAQLTSFIAGLLTAGVIWSLGRAIRRSFFLHPPRQSKRQDDDGDDESDDESSSSNFDDVDSFSPPSSFNSSPLFRKIAVRWPWDKIRTSMLNASASFRKLEHASSTATTTTKTGIDKTGHCIGEIFGLDVGGSLTKLVYFEQQIEECKRREVHEGLHRREHYAAAASALEVLQVRRSASSVHLRHNSHSDENLQPLWRLRQQSEPDSLNQFASSCNLNVRNIQPRTEEQQQQQRSDNESSKGMGSKRSLSMINLTKSPGHAEALDNFYSFARRLDTYETAVKDKYLSYYSRFLNGTFHFIRFETRRMDHAINLIRYTNFHVNIKKIGATGAL